MRKIVSSWRNPLAAREDARIAREHDEPNPLWALAVGLVYVFRTKPGHRIMRELERAVRKYASDPGALWRLVKNGEDIIDVSASETKVIEDGKKPDD